MKMNKSFLVTICLFFAIFVLKSECLPMEMGTKDSIENQDVQYNDLLLKARALETNGDYSEALELLYISICIERYEACSYYGMLDIGRIYLEQKQYAKSIYYLKNYIKEVDGEFLPGSPCGAYSSEQTKVELKNSVKKAEKLLGGAIDGFCKDTTKRNICERFKPLHNPH